jgi:hypothetical protein
MKLFWRLTAAGAVVLGLGAVFVHSRPAQGQEVAPPPRAARSTETVDLQVPAGTYVVLATSPPSKHFSQDGERIVEGDATIVMARERSSEEAKRLLRGTVQYEDTKRLLKEADQGDVLRLRVRESRVTLRMGQAHYPSQIFIEPLSK